MKYFLKSLSIYIPLGESHLTLPQSLPTRWMSCLTPSPQAKEVLFDYCISFFLQHGLCLQHGLTFSSVPFVAFYIYSFRAADFCKGQLKKFWYVCLLSHIFEPLFRAEASLKSVFHTFVTFITSFVQIFSAQRVILHKDDLLAVDRKIRSVLFIQTWVCSPHKDIFKSLDSIYSSWCHVKKYPPRRGSSCHGLFLYDTKCILGFCLASCGVSDLVLLLNRKSWGQKVSGMSAARRSLFSSVYALEGNSLR